MTTYTTNLLLPELVPLAATTNNTWGITTNTAFVMIDNAVAGVLTLPVSSGTIVLTSTNGAPDQSRNRLFVLTGTLTGNITILFPQSLARFFSVQNKSSGAHTVTIGANNGSNVPAGNTITVPGGAIGQLYSDGTNVNSDGASGTSLQQTAFFNTAVGGSANSSTPSVYASFSFTPLFSGSTIVVDWALQYQNTIVIGEAQPRQLNAFLSFGGIVIQVGDGGFSFNTSIGLGPQGCLYENLQTVSPGTSPQTVQILAFDPFNGSGSNTLQGAQVLIQEWL